MALPVSEYISLNVLTTLQGLTRAKGYAVDAYAYRLGTNATPPSIVDGSIEITSSPPQRALQLTGKDEWTMAFDLLAYLNQASDTNEPIDKVCNLFAAAMSKLLMADYARGGYAIDTMLGNVKPFAPGAGQEGFVFSFTVQFRTNSDDPYTL